MSAALRSLEVWLFPGSRWPSMGAGCGVFGFVLIFSHINMCDSSPRVFKLSPMYLSRSGYFV